MTRARASPRKGCRVCASPETSLIEGGVLAGWSARAVAKRVGGVNRKDVAAHMEWCVNREKEESCER